MYIFAHLLVLLTSTAVSGDTKFCGACIDKKILAIRDYIPEVKIPSGYPECDFRRSGDRSHYAVECEGPCVTVDYQYGNYVSARSMMLHCGSLVMPTVNMSNKQETDFTTKIGFRDNLRVSTCDEPMCNYQFKEFPVLIYCTYSANSTFSTCPAISFPSAMFHKRYLIPRRRHSGVNGLSLFQGLLLVLLQCY